MTPIEKFWAKVDKTCGCWVWTASTAKGYGKFWLDGKLWLAHRLSYTLVKGPIPEGYELDHLCLNKRCVNPEHLEPVPYEGRENSRRHQAAKTHCPRGHEYSPTNTYIQMIAGRPGRSCKTCRREALHRFEERNPGRRRKGATR